MSRPSLPRPALRRPALAAGALALVLGALGGGSLLLRAARAQETAPPAAERAEPAVQRSPLAVRGEYLARAADCVACHSAPGGKAYAGGRAFKLPFGVMYATNITPDRATGIGSYTDDQFVAALQHGVRRDGQNLYPSMPYTSYTGMSRDDALAIKAYLFSLPAVRAPAPENRLSFPFNQRWGMALWNLVFFKDQRFQPDPGRSTQENRGKYLATALGHCGECHTPRNFAYAQKRHHQFAGAVVEGWRAYNITSDKRFGLGGWSDQAIAQYLSTAHADGHGSASGSMGEAVENSLQYLTPDDLSALVAYLRKVPAQPGVPGSEIDPAPGPMRASSAWAPGSGDAGGDLGKHVFESACASCHQWNGQGQQTPYAALAGSQAVNDPSGYNLVQVMLHGARVRTAKDAVYMPAFGRGYTDAELAAAANYVIGHFGGKQGKVTPEFVKKARAQ